MTAIPILSGIVADRGVEFRQSPPLNLEPIPIDNKIGKGQLRVAAGIRQIGTGPGNDRGGIYWNGACYRVMGPNLVRVSADGGVTIIGTVGGTGHVRLDYSFSHLGIRSNQQLWLYDGVTLAQVADEDLGAVIDYLWIDGYHMTADGTAVVVTELSDPFSVLPLKYGSAEEDPDAITGLMKVREEAYVLGRYTIQVLQNVGGGGFPFANVRGAGMQFGCVGPNAKAYYAESFAFVGSGRNEGLGVYVAGQGTAAKISTRLIDDALAGVTDERSIILDVRTDRDESRLILRLPDATFAYYGSASAAFGEPIWCLLGSGDGDLYRPTSPVLVNGTWIVGDTRSAAVGVLDESVSAHFGEPTAWQFDAGPIYNAGKGGIVHEVELVGLPGRSAVGVEPVAFCSTTTDGETWSAEKRCGMGKSGERGKKMRWRLGRKFATFIGLRFRGYDAGLAGFAACEADIEALSV